ncbi:MAG: carbohydrate-binding domain-containing protein [Clostridia bacterium]|nr:carbohydrate-binding domain-containing protein [Clostridia bacterium]
MRKNTIIALTTVLGLSLLAGCGAVDGTEDDNSLSTDTISSVSISEDEMFTDRDREIGYSVSDCETVTLSDSGSTSSSDAVSISDSTVTITDEGSYIISGSLSNGQLIVNAENTDKVQIILDGVSITNSSSAAIYIMQADKVFITTANDSENSLSVTGDYVQTDDNTVDAAIFSKDDLTLNGAGSLTIKADYGHGVVSKNDLVITSGSYDITSAATGLSGKDSVRIGGGEISIDAGVDGIHSKNADDETLGFIYIAAGSLNITADSDGLDAMTTLSVVGGSISVTAGDDGLHADGQTMISGGSIDIPQSYEGIEGKSIEISGGTINIVSSDDGLNAAGGNNGSGMMGFGGTDQFASDGDIYIIISGGTININASGDGIDSNGNFTVTDGYTVVSGPTDSGNGTLDYGEGATALISGGTILGAGSSGMVEPFSDSSEQCSILYLLGSTVSGGTTVTLKDSSGNVLVSFTPEKTFSSVNISLPELTSDGTYTLTIGTTEYEITMTSTALIEIVALSMCPWKIHRAPSGEPSVSANVSKRCTRAPRRR